jgi:hypothetical protein
MRNVRDLNFTIGWIGWFAIGIHQTSLSSKNSASLASFITEAIFHVQKEALSHQSCIHSTAAAAALNAMSEGGNNKNEKILTRDAFSLYAISTLAVLSTTRIELQHLRPYLNSCLCAVLRYFGSSLTTPASLPLCLGSRRLADTANATNKVRRIIWTRSCCLNKLSRITRTAVDF